jgi:hypothetical protein
MFEQNSGYKEFQKEVGFGKVLFKQQQVAACITPQLSTV